MFDIARKEVSGDGRCVKIFYYNGDIKETNKDEGMVKYLYSHTQTWHNTYQDGREVLVFKNGQEEVTTTTNQSYSYPSQCVSDPLSGLVHFHFLS